MVFLGVFYVKCCTEDIDFKHKIVVHTLYKVDCFTSWCITFFINWNQIEFNNLTFHSSSWWYISWRSICEWCFGNHGIRRFLWNFRNSLLVYSKVWTWCIKRDTSWKIHYHGQIYKSALYICKKQSIAVTSHTWCHLTAAKFIDIVQLIFTISTIETCYVITHSLTNGPAY